MPLQSATRYFLLVSLALCFVGFADAQGTRQTAGEAGPGIRIRVVDDYGEPAPGVAVWAGKTRIASTDTSGLAVVPASYAGSRIEFRLDGFYPSLVRCGDGGPSLVRLAPSYLRDPARIPVLYEDMPGRSMVGSVAAVYTPQLTTTPTSLYLNALTGRLPGLYTQETSGFRTALTNPTTVNDLAGSLPNDATKYSSSNSDNSEMFFQLRGQSPVTIIDGVQRNIYSLDPEDIQSVTVLKDALSTLLLGMKSSVGVLQITTKKGEPGPPRISLTAQTGVQTPLTTPKPLSSYQYAYLYNEALRNSGKPEAYSASDFYGYRYDSSAWIYPDVNWYDAITRKSAPISKYDLNVNGGIKNATYSMSLSYLNQEGMFRQDPQTDYNTNLSLNRYIINSDIDVNVTHDFTVSLQLFGRVQDGRQPGAGTQNILNALATTPDNAYPVFNPNGSYGGSAAFTNNLYEMTTGSGYLLDNERDLLANVDLRYNFSEWLPGLYIKGKVNVSSSSSSLVNRSKTDPVYGLSLDDKGDTVYSRFGAISDMGNAFNATSNVQVFYAQAAAGFDTTLGGSSVGGMFFADQQVATYQFDLPEKYTNLAFTAHYDYQQKYFAQLAVDEAGFNRYAPGHRFGFVYAGGLGWDLAREPFLRAQSAWLSQLKLRATYGKTAYSNESSLGYFTWRNAFGQDGNNGYPAGTTYSFVNGIHELGLANVNATWEKAHKLDVGADIGLFSDRLRLTADYYHDVYYDLLEQRGATIALMGLGYPNENIGKNLYAGEELSVTYQDHAGSLHYFVTANVSRMRTKVLYMDEVKRSYPWNRRTGKPVGQLFGYEADGLVPNQAAADTLPTVAGATLHPGDVRLVDLNHDGVIDQFDETAIGSTRPQVFYGATLGCSVKGFDFSVLFQGVANRSYLMIDNSFGSGTQQGYAYLLGRWTPETAATATYPRLTIGADPDNDSYSSYWIRSGDYLRVRNIDIGYTLPFKITSRVRIASLRIFLNAENLFTETPYDRLDPEVPGSASYPIQRTINGGVNIKF